MRNLVRKLAPRWAKTALANLMERVRHRSYSGLPIQQVFSRIYSEKEWGRKDSGDFYSGPGSHDVSIVAPYVIAIRKYLQDMPIKPVVVDLGCGDFNVGSQIFDCAREYHACDIVPELQQFNQSVYGRANLHFHCVNAIDDPLPDGDVVLIRQVLQHLSNAQIAKIISGCQKYSTWIVTEHLPSRDNFIPNVDISAGCGIRPLFNSGVVLTEAPFNLPKDRVTQLLEIDSCGDRIRTVVFKAKSVDN